MMYLSELICGEVIKTPVTGVSFSQSYDVIICGLGTAGSIAAIAAGRQGLSVLGVEAFNCVGGTMTIGGIQGHYFGCPGGIHIQIDRDVEAFAAQHTRNQLESRKIIAQEQILACGCQILYESSVCGIYLEADTVVGLRVITPTGTIDYGCKVLLDCTGDAYAAHMAGCESEYGRALDGLTQPYTMVSSNRVGPEVSNTNFDFGRVDQRSDEALSKALIFSRAYEMQEERGGKQLMLHMPLIGIREGRRILAQETVKTEDVLAGRFTETPMFYSYADLDKHGWDIAFDGVTLGNWSIGANLGAYNLTIPVPYLCIVPKQIDGLLVPCRALGVDRDASSCIRMIPDMKKVGEAGAYMALLSIRYGCPLREIPYSELRALLLATGCLDSSHNRGCRIDGRMYDCDGQPLIKEAVHFTDDPEQLEQRLATRKPGQAIWAAGRMGQRAVPALLPLLESQNTDLQRHAALALAAAGDRRALPLLRQMVLQRDSYGLKDCRKNNQRRGCMSIYWLGILADAEIADVLMERLLDPREHLHDAYTKAEIDKTARVIHGFNEVYFQFTTQAIMALIRIADAHPALRPRTAQAFRSAFSGESYYSRFTQRPKMSSEGSMVLNLGRVALSAADRWDHNG